MLCSCHVEMEESNKRKGFLLQLAINHIIKQLKMAIANVTDTDADWNNSYLALNRLGVKQRNMFLYLPH